MAHRPTIETKKLVRDLSVLKRSQEDIAKQLGINVLTLVKHYEYELYYYKFEIVAEAQSKLIKAMKADERWAIEMILKCLGGYAPAKAPEELEALNRNNMIAEYILNKINANNNTLHGLVEEIKDKHHVIDGEKEAHVIEGN